MNNINKIEERLYLTSLLSIDWEIFSKNARLTFGDDNIRLILYVERIHCAIFRQSLLLQPRADSFGPNCHVHYVGISKKTDFLERYLSDMKLLPSHIVPYDISNKTPSDASFQKPYHLSIVCSSGDLDILADFVELEESKSA